MSMYGEFTNFTRKQYVEILSWRKSEIGCKNETGRKKKWREGDEMKVRAIQ